MVGGGAIGGVDRTTRELRRAEAGRAEWFGCVVVWSWKRPRGRGQRMRRPARWLPRGASPIYCVAIIYLVKATLLLFFLNEKATVLVTCSRAWSHGGEGAGEVENIFFMIQVSGEGSRDFHGLLELRSGFPWMLT